MAPGKATDQDSPFQVLIVMDKDILLKVPNIPSAPWDWNSVLKWLWHGIKRGEVYE